MSKGENYEKFVEKFKRKKTTDDCMTPELVYKAVLDFVTEKYGVDRSSVIRPFWPGGDYQSEDYTGKTVVDNPPFSILKQIVNFYADRKIPFFLFANGLTCLNVTRDRDVCVIPVGAKLTYANGANVNTAFVTSLEPAGTAVTVYPELADAIKRASDAERSKAVKHVPTYDYPDTVFTAAMGAYMATHGTPFRIHRKDARFIHELDAQRAVGKSIFGGGLLLSEKAAAEKAAAEKAAAERAAAEKAAAEKAAAEKWALSERELAIVRALGREET